MYYFLSHHPNPAPAYGRICFFTLHFVNRPMLGLFSRIKSTVKSIQACRGRWKSFEDWGRRPWVGSSMAAAEFPCHRLRGFRHGALALLELGARLGCWSYRTAYVLRPGRSIAVSGSQRSFSGLAYIGRLDWQSILMKSAAHVRVFNKFNMPPFISARA